MKGKQRNRSAERTQKPRTSKGGVVFAIVWGILLVAFAAYVMLVKLVIPQELEPAGQDDETPQELQGETDFTGTGINDAFNGSTSTITVEGKTNSATVKKFRWLDSDIYVADIYVTSPQEIKSCFANDTYGLNITEETSSMAKRNNAIVAINGDFYGCLPSGYVIRNGVLYRSTMGNLSERPEDLVIMNDGSFRIIRENEVTAEQLMADGAWQLLAFGPALVIDHEVPYTRQEFNQRYDNALNPRSAVGWINDLHYVFVMACGRLSGQAGLHMYDLGVFMKNLGCKTAYNCDGGVSATLYVNGERVSPICDTLSGDSRSNERKVSDILYVAAN